MDVNRFLVGQAEAGSVDAAIDILDRFAWQVSAGLVPDRELLDYVGRCMETIVKPALRGERPADANKAFHLDYAQSPGRPTKDLEHPHYYRWREDAVRDRNVEIAVEVERLLRTGAAASERKAHEIIADARGLSYKTVRDVHLTHRDYAQHILDIESGAE